MIRLDNISLGYTNRTLIDSLSAHVEQGKLTALVGRNGTGKSTTLKLLAGLHKSHRGKLEINGSVGVLPQNPQTLFVKKTVREDLEEMTSDKALIAQMAATCQIEKFLDSHPYDLSGGEQQRAALAKVLLTQPKLLLLDEPTKGIDSFFKETFAGILQELKAKGITIIMVSHDVEFCARYADLVSMFFDGQILTTDTPRRFFGNNSFYTTAANRMSHHLFTNAVTVADVLELYKENGGAVL